MNAMYIGSFDPFTLGHLDIAHKALQKCEKLIICVGKNEAKTPMFSTKERLEFIELAIQELPRAENIIVILSDDLTVNIARQNNINTLIRGIRSDADMQTELSLAETNRFLAAQQGFELTTDFFTQEDELKKTISSSLVRKLLEMEQYTAAYRCLPLAIAQKIIASQLEERFCKGFTSPFFYSKDNCNKIINAYLARPYHNLLHLAYMFDMLKLYLKQSNPREQPDWLESLEIAILLHDYVYEPTQPEAQPYYNETASVSFVTSMTKEFMCYRHLNLPLISSLIMATTHDDTYLAKTPEAEEPCQVIADLDLSILGTADSSSWKNYTSGIRKEYAAYSDEKYTKGRLAFLSSLLQKEQIFHTKFFNKMLEKQARENIKNEIERLQQS